MITPPWRIGASIIAAVAVFAAARYIEHRLEMRGYNKAQAEYAEAAFKAAQAARKRERALHEKITTTAKEAEHEKNRLRTQRDAALASLRNRPERPSGDAVPGTPAPGMACTGASLFRADAEFLVREAARADQLRADLQACQAAYDSARDAVNNINTEKSSP